MADENMSGMSRRTFLKTSAVATGAGVAGSGVASAQSDEVGGWFDNVSNFDGVIDHTGESKVTITVGAEQGSGAFGFGPAAVRVDPGTTVVWEWNGKGGSHNVVAVDGSFESELTGDEGFTFEQTFEETGTTKYFCAPHKSMGMKGAIVVGGEGNGGSDSGSGDGSGTGTYELVGIGVLASLIVGVLLALPISEMRKKNKD